ncbi:MAG: hypothetical protein JRG94_20790 [Deltaproteobacteria bacterium]|nr:hypothetical protein [Deltaproteobacteria bacterium]
MSNRPLWFRIAGILLASAAALSFSACSSAPKKGTRTILMTEYDDVQVGRDAAQSVAAQIGIMPDKALNDYVKKIGRKLLLGVPRRYFRYGGPDRAQRLCAARRPHLHFARPAGPGEQRG